mmetsp:Transcript_16544/g.33818  ORF Transcript_16544/g.33818 Transcript_16544/m.33818 type:complete len:164 (-) Transcript_16544:9381-9872(-)
MNSTSHYQCSNIWTIEKRSWSRVWARSLFSPVGQVFERAHITANALTPSLLASVLASLGVSNLVKFFASKGLVQAIATSSSRDLFHVKARPHREFFDRHFPIVVCAEDVTRGKPFPDPFLLASQRLNVSPSKCVVFEDAPVSDESLLPEKLPRSQTLQHCSAI